MLGRNASRRSITARDPSPQGPAKRFVTAEDSSQSRSEPGLPGSVKINQVTAADRAADASLPAADRALIEDLRAALAAAADPIRAPGMQAYMKSTMPYYGVPSTPLRRLTREASAAHPLRTFEAWRDTLLALWREAAHREERYAALELAARPAYRAYRTRAALPLYEEFVVTGAWWDLVDGTAHLLRDLVRDDHEWMAARMRQWARDADLWKRRAAIISQLGLKAATDWPLLQDCIEPNLEDGSFPRPELVEGPRPELVEGWIRKAIGWALRDYAKTAPDAVRAYVQALGPRLSGLSRREALKHLDDPLHA